MRLKESLMFCSENWTVITYIETGKIQVWWRILYLFYIYLKTVSIIYICKIGIFLLFIKLIFIKTFNMLRSGFAQFTHATRYRDKV